MNTIATINFKGGVGKTTVTWCLADILANYGYNLNALVFDLDAQMSLTQAIALNDIGSLNENFGNWYLKAKEHKKTIFNALDIFASPKRDGHFDFGIGYDFIYKASNNLHFVPSDEELYWMELEVYDRTSVKEFIRTLLAKIDKSNKVLNYQYALFDCPPSFTLLSYSVLANCDLILIPVNPDFFASKGVGLLIDSLRWRIDTHPIPKIGVFMNKAKMRSGKCTKETDFYWNEVKMICKNEARKNNLDVKLFETKIPDLVAIKRAITANGVPNELISPFRNLWTEINQYLNQ